MKLIGKHKFTIFIIMIYIVIVVFAFFVYQTFWVNNNNPQWGNRLDGIEDVKIGSEQYKSMKLEIEKNEKVKEVVYDLRGKTINVVITVDDTATIAEAKKFGESVLTFFETKQLEFYSFQVFAKKTDTKLNDFPIIGYKHYTSPNLVWTKDRKVSE